MFEKLIATIWAQFQKCVTRVIVFLEHLLLLRVPHWKQPPGPLANFLPFFGSLVLFPDVPAHVVMTKISTNYERIYRLMLGKTTFIVICDPALLQETFAMDAVSGRNTYLMNVTNQHGLINTDGEFWRSQRSFVHQTLSALGLPRNAWVREFDRKANEAIGALVIELRGHHCDPIFLDESLCFALSNIFFSMIVGRTFSRDDTNLLAIINSSHERFRVTEPISLANFLPQFVVLPTNSRILHSIESSKHRFIDYIIPIVQDHRMHFVRENPRDLIDYFLLRMGNGEPFFTEIQLYSLLGDLFSASLESSAATIHWILLALIKYPGIQQRIFYEIMDVTMGEREPTLDDRPDMPYTEATVLEGYRFPSVFPFGVPHTTSEDTIIEGYHIPERSTVVGLFWKFNRDPKLWKNPNCFDPRNHFDNDGTLVRRPYLMPFSVGRRDCISETVANDIIFLIVVNLINNFLVVDARAHTVPSMDDSLGGVLRAPLPYKVMMVPRDPH